LPRSPSAARSPQHTQHFFAADELDVSQHEEVPVVELNIPEDELASSDEDNEDHDESLHAFDEVLDAGVPTAVQLPRHTQAATTAATQSTAQLVTASLFAAKYMSKPSKAQAHAPYEADAEPALRSPSGSSKPKPKAVRHTYNAAVDHNTVAPKPTVASASKDKLEIRYDAIDALQHLQLDQAHLPVPPLTAYAVPHSAYFDPHPASFQQYESPAPPEEEGDYYNPGDYAMEGEEEEKSIMGEEDTATSHARERREAASTRIRDDASHAFASPQALSGFVIDMTVSPTSPRKLNILTLCNTARNDYELGDQLGWPRDRPHPVSVLVLRENGVTHPERLSLSLRFECLTDLDLRYNNICDAVKGLPATLQRLDLSHNRISNVSSLMQCPQLVDLNLSHNDIKSFHSLPAKLEKLDLSNNTISAAITLRTLALSPLIRSLNVSDNPILLEMKDWKVVLPSLLPRLEELNWKPLFTVKRADALMKQMQQKQRAAAVSQPSSLPGNEAQQTGSPRRPQSPSALRQEQRISDALRMRHDDSKFLALEQARREYEDRFRRRSAILRPVETEKLTQRLTAPTKAASIRANTLLSPPPLFSQLDLLHRKYPRRGQGAASGGSPGQRSLPSGADHLSPKRSSPSTRIQFYSAEALSPGAKQHGDQPLSQSVGNPWSAHSEHTSLPGSSPPQRAWSVDNDVVSLLQGVVPSLDSPEHRSHNSDASHHTAHSQSHSVLRVQEAPEPQPREDPGEVSPWSQPNTCRSELTNDAADSPRTHAAGAGAFVDGNNHAAATGYVGSDNLGTTQPHGSSRDSAAIGSASSEAGVFASAQSGVFASAQSGVFTSAQCGVPPSASLDSAFLSNDNDTRGGRENRDRFDSMAYSVLSDEEGGGAVSPRSAAAQSVPSLPSAAAEARSTTRAASATGVNTAAAVQDGDEYSVATLSTAADIPPAGVPGSVHASSLSYTPIPPSPVPAAAVAARSAGASPPPSGLTSTAAAEGGSPTKLCATVRHLARMAKGKK
jgi:Leucine-rich repeat (LRR) protein